MSGKYVPPSKRAGYVPSTSSIPPTHVHNGGFRARWTPGTSLPEGVYSRQDLEQHFTHNIEGTLNHFSHLNPSFHDHKPRKGYDPTRALKDPQEIPLPFSPPPGLPIHPLKHLVSYIVLFPNAHPCWEKDRELWVHTSAEYIIEDEEGERKNFGRPLPVFQHAQARDTFRFAGWWILDRIEQVQPRSDALAKMLETKEAAKSYSRGGRSSEAWRSSFNTLWIKMFFKASPPTSQDCDELKDPMKVKGGEDGEIERYLLEVGGLKDEVEVLDGTQEVKKEIAEEARHLRAQAL